MTPEDPNTSGRPSEPPPPGVPAEGSPIPDRPTGMVSRERLGALAQRVGPSMDALKARPFLAWLVVVTFMLVTGIAFGLYALQAFVHAKKIVVVPDLKGKSVDQALELLSEADLSMTRDAVELNETVPPGAILKQSPPAGVKVREGKVVRVTVSSGGTAIFAPDLSAKPLPEAQNQIQSAGLSIGAVAEAFSLRYEPGWVMEQVPLPGTVLKRGQMVDLKVSKGPPPEDLRLMPDFTNQPVAKAVQWARAEGFRASVSEEAKPDTAGGLVVNQTPAPDAVLQDSVAVKFVATPAGNTTSRTFRYRVPGDSGRVQVRISLRHENEEEERIAFEGEKNGGELVEVPLTNPGRAQARIFVNGVLVDEETVE
jgi:eukaryotic-like serine/threonine-protein kinase